MTDRTVPRRRGLTRSGGLLAFSLAFLLTLVAIPATASAYIYWSSGSHIGRANLDGTGANPQWVNTNTSDIGELAVDSSRLYWSIFSAGHRQIASMNVNGSGINLNAVPGVTGQAIAWGVAVDDAHIWFTTTGSGSIGRANLNGSGLNAGFIPSVQARNHLAVDGTHVYWSTTEGNIGRANLDGTGANANLITGSSDVRGVAVSANHVYWANWQTNKIGRANLDGTGVNQSFISTSGAPTGVDVEGNHVYWSNSGNVGRANLDGTGVNTAFVAGVGADEIAVAPDIEPPSLTINSGPNGPTPSNTPSFGFTAGSDATSVTCSIDAGTPSFGACSGAGSHTPASPLADGSYTFRVKASDAVPNAVTQTRSFLVDTTLPTTTISSGPNGPTNDPTFSFGSNEAGATFECRLDTGSWESCASPKTYTGIGDGAHTVDVRATDTAGNVATATDSRSFTLDQTPPGTTITSEPAPTTNDTTPTFAFSSNDATATFQCRPGAGPWASCASPVTLGPLTDGVQYFEVRAVDAVGNADPDPEFRTFSVFGSSPPIGGTPPAVDTTAPVTTITTKPKSKIKAKGKKAKAGVSFSSEPGATFECQLDKAAIAPCTSPFNVSAKAKKGKGAKHTISIRATDAAGNVGTPATADFTVVRKAKKKHK